MKSLLERVGFFLIFVLLLKILFVILHLNLKTKSI